MVVADDGASMWRVAGDTVAEGFAGYCECALPLQVPESQFEAMREAFYAGAVVMHGMMVHLASKLAENPDDLTPAHQIGDELRAWIDGENGEGEE